MQFTLVWWTATVDFTSLAPGFDTTPPVFTAFGLSHNDKCLVAGTEAAGEDVFLIFWYTKQYSFTVLNCKFTVVVCCLWMLKFKHSHIIETNHLVSLSVSDLVLEQITCLIVYAYYISHIWKLLMYISCNKDKKIKNSQINLRIMCYQGHSYGWWGSSWRLPGVTPGWHHTGYALIGICCAYLCLKSLLSF